MAQSQHCIRVLFIEERILLMIEHGANIYTEDKYGFSLLFSAIKVHALKICEKLIQVDATLVNKPNKYDKPPLYWAIPAVKDQSHNSVDFKIFNLLLEHSSNFNSYPYGHWIFELLKNNDHFHNNGLTNYIKQNYPHLMT